MQKYKQMLLPNTHKSLHINLIVYNQVSISISSQFVNLPKEKSHSASAPTYVNWHPEYLSQAPLSLLVLEITRFRITEIPKTPNQWNYINL